MSSRSLGWTGVLALAIASSAAAQTRPAKAWTAPRTADGKPDLQGIWTNATITPMERPAEFAGKAVLTEKEAADYEQRIVQGRNMDKRNKNNADADVAGAYNDAWYDRGTKVVGSRRTSLVIDPPDGKIPALTPEAQKEERARNESRRHPAYGPEDRGLSERCIQWPTSGPPMLPSGYNNNYQIFQTPGYVVILTEMIHDVRVIPLDGRPHLPSDVRQWMGDSRGHWEGDTLVVDTINYTDKTHLRGSDRNLHIIERFTRTDADTITYRFTADDPSAFTKPWTVEIPMVKAPGPIYEYACHEGNYGMVGILAGARAEEEAAARSGKEGAK